MRLWWELGGMWFEEGGGRVEERALLQDDIFLLEKVVSLDEVLEGGFVGGEGSFLEAGRFGGKGLAALAFESLAVVHDCWV